MRQRILCLHVADLHVGKNRKFEDYLEQQGYMLSGIVGQLRDTAKANPDADVYLCVAGDVFDRNQDTRMSEFCLFLTEFIKPLIEIKCQFDNVSVFIIDGNHDRQPSNEQPSVLSPVAPLFSDYFHFAVVEPRFIAEHSMLLIPYGGYSSIELRSLIQKYNPYFVMGHECLNRMTTDTGWSVENKKSEFPRDQDHYIEINEVLPDTNVVGIFLGDIHKCQALDEKQICWYSGSPVTLDHGHRLPKGVLHHFYERTADGIQRIKLPELKPLEDPRIKIHKQLGLIDKVEKIPWDKCLQFKDAYIDMVVTPEVQAEIDTKIPGFFHSKQITYSHKETPVEIETSSLEVEEKVTGNYYKIAIREWFDLNKNDLPVTLKTEAINRLDKLFEGRGE
jgi:DNA repair exonuclease SbcCD nuclease subunit